MGTICQPEERQQFHYQTVVHAAEHTNPVPYQPPANLYQQFAISKEVKDEKLLQFLKNEQALEFAPETSVVQKLKNGHFQGKIQNGKAEGKGIYLSEKGVIIGQFNESKPVGKSIFLAKINDKISKVERVSSQDGKQIIQYKSSDYDYQGEISGNQRNGQGSQRFIAANSGFEGIFINGRRQRGKYTYSDGTVYQGPFHKDQPSSEGQYIFNDRTRLTRLVKIQEGHYNAVCNYPDGTSYIGELKGGLRDGQGKYIVSDKHFYEGEFRKGLRHGQGKLIIAGKTYKAKYLEGKLHALDF